MIQEENTDAKLQNDTFDEEQNPASETGCTNDEGQMSDTLADGADKTAEEVEMWKDKYIRLQAEFENYRRRTVKEKMELLNTGGEDVMRSMLEVLDDMDRAMAAMTQTDNMQSVREGMALIANKLYDTMKSKGLEEVDAIGAELDTDLHEAVAKIEVQDAEMKGRIVDVLQKGYKLKDKIIRYAKVVVGQ